MVMRMKNEKIRFFGTLLRLARFFRDLRSYCHKIAVVYE